MNTPARRRHPTKYTSMYTVYKRLIVLLVRATLERSLQKSYDPCNMIRQHGQQVSLATVLRIIQLRFTIIGGLLKSSNTREIVKQNQPDWRPENCCSTAVTINSFTRLITGKRAALAALLGSGLPSLLLSEMTTTETPKPNIDDNGDDINQNYDDDGNNCQPKRYWSCHEGGWPVPINARINSIGTTTAKRSDSDSVARSTAANLRRSKKFQQMKEWDSHWKTQWRRTAAEQQQQSGGGSGGGGDDNRIVALFRIIFLSSWHFIKTLLKALIRARRAVIFDPWE